VSFPSYLTDFLGSVFAVTQLELDSLIAGYSFFLNDPRLNIAKTLLAVFSLFNTAIVLGQMWYYRRINQSDDDFKKASNAIN